MNTQSILPTTMATEAEKRKETTKLQWVQTITLHEECYTYVKIDERTDVKRSTCFDIVKNDTVRRKPRIVTAHTANTPRKGRPEKPNH